MDRREPLVSVIIPSYNHAAYIRDAISSVREQTYQNWELIVVDDGSTDGTSDVLRQLPTDSRIRVVLNRQNRGQSAVVNQALALSHGEFISILPSDDWYLPEKLALQVRKFSECDESVGVVYGRGDRFFPYSGKTIPVDLPMRRGWVLGDFIRLGNFVYPVTPLFRRACFDFARPDETYTAEGEAIYLKIAIRYAFEFVDAKVAVMRDHESNTGKRRALMHVENLRYWEEFASRADLPEDARKLLPHAFYRLHRLHGLELVLFQDDMVGGRASLLRALEHRPAGMFDARLAAGLLLTALPRSASATILRGRRARRI